MDVTTMYIEYLEYCDLPWPEIIYMHCTAVMCVINTPITSSKIVSKVTPDNIFHRSFY